MGSIQEQSHTDQQALLDAQLELWHSTFAFIKSMALKYAMELRIADAIHHHGGTATITQIATKITLHPSKIPCMRRLMRVLTVTGIFSIAKPQLMMNCKKAIPPRDAGGKVIIVDTVVGAGPSNLKHKGTQVLYDLFFMIVNGIERDEKEWRKIIFGAGFTDYKIIPVLGVRSIIELYP
ncbi:unnamed protein product [Urochloa decumbens]|uniref:Uncharacterized protein n=1 Tax=Urochloa decumbens TaxID=240449 RepID=A0ABC9GWY7_9POAL